MQAFRIWEPLSNSQRQPTRIKNLIDYNKVVTPLVELSTNLA